ncbi:MAG: hypothetical protein ABDH49_03260 [Candidatus Hydrothermales bacterium]
MENKKYISVLSYLGILFIVPLILEPNDEFVKFHVKQGIMLFAFFMLVFIVGGIIPIIGWFIIWPIGILIWILFVIIGISNTLSGKMEELPIIGKYANKLNI